MSGYTYNERVDLSTSRTLKIERFQLRHEMNIKEKHSDDWVMCKVGTIFYRVNGGFFIKGDVNEPIYTQMEVDKAFFEANQKLLFNKI